MQSLTWQSIQTTISIHINMGKRTQPLKSIDPTGDMFPISEAKEAEYVQVAVCFVDLRGFTQFAGTKGYEGKITKVLSCMFKSLNAALHDARKNVEGETTFAKAIMAASWPQVMKPLGDGAMIVWDYPGPRTDNLETGFDLFVLDFVAYAQAEYYENITRLGDWANTRAFEKLHLGIGLSKGLAWKMTNLGTAGIDYAGNTINEAARLQDQARFHGVVVNLEFAPHLLMERFCYEKGSNIHQAGPLKNIEKPPSVWTKIHTENQNQLPSASEILGWRRPRKATLEDVLTLLKQRPIDFDFARGPRPLTEDDTLSLFDLRPLLESQFAADLAEKVCRNELSKEDLEPVAKTIRDMLELLSRFEHPDEINWKSHWSKCGTSFHSGIALLSDADDAIGRLRRQFTEEVYKDAEPLYKFATGKTVLDYERVVNEHSRILDAIINGDSLSARRRMEDHLRAHYRSARAVLSSRVLQHEETLPK